MIDNPIINPKALIDSMKTWLRSIPEEWASSLQDKSITQQVFNHAPDTQSYFFVIFWAWRTTTVSITHFIPHTVCPTSSLSLRIQFLIFIAELVFHTFPCLKMVKNMQDWLLKIPNDWLFELALTSLIVSICLNMSRPTNHIVDKPYFVYKCWSCTNSLLSSIFLNLLFDYGWRMFYR